MHIYIIISEIIKHASGSDTSWHIIFRLLHDLLESSGFPVDLELDTISILDYILSKSRYMGYYKSRKSEKFKI